MGGVVTTVPPAPRTRTLWILAGVVVAVGFAPGLIVRATAADPLEPAVVERDIAAEFEQREGIALDLDCPRNMPIASGNTYTCDGTTSDGRQLEVSITISDDLDGSYTWSDSPVPVTPAIPAPSPGG